jgi:hypothetical protein
MKTGTVRWLPLAMGISILAGCQHNQSAITKISPALPAQPFVFYDETGDPSERTPALSENELREILDWVAIQTSDPVWLIRVRPSVGKIRNDMVAYLVPDEATPRIRVGRAYNIPKSKERAESHSPWQYAQVSLAGHSFGAQLTRPSVKEMPFYFPKIVNPSSRERVPMPEQEIVSILDFVRHRSNGIPIVGALLGHTIGPKGPNLPVVGITQSSEGLEVQLGFVHGPLWGHGVIIRIKTTKNGYQVVDWGNWIS